MTKMLKRVLQDVLSEEENEQLISAFDSNWRHHNSKNSRLVSFKKTDYWKNSIRTS